MDVERALARFGGLATRDQLRALGCGNRAIAAYVETHGNAVRRSWVAAPGTDPAAVRAVTLGGMLGGESALRSYGIWVSHNTGLCVVVKPGTSRLPPPGENEYRIYPRSYVRPNGIRWRADVLSALLQLAPRVGSRDLVASIDSALHTRMLSASRVDDLFARLPQRSAATRSLIDARAESGLESLFRVAAVREGWSVAVQVAIPGVGRVDFVIDSWLVIEVDGDQWHSTWEQRTRDRDREAELVRRGMRFHRFGYRQVMSDLAGCIEVTRTLLAAGRP
jgi:very-short-patch-repair endonuclease